VSVFSDEAVYFASQQREKIVYDCPIVCHSGREYFFSRGNHAKRWNRLRMLLDEAVHERANEAVVDIHKVFRQRASVPRYENSKIIEVSGNPK